MESSKTSQKLERDDKGRLLPGQESLNPNGRPKGSALKEYQAQRFRDMTDKEKDSFLKTVAPDVRWKMAEGNPQNDLTTGGEKLSIDITDEKYAAIVAREHQRLNVAKDSE